MKGLLCLSVFLLGISFVAAYHLDQPIVDNSIYGVWSDSRFGGEVYICDSAVPTSDPTTLLNFTGVFSNRGFLQGYQVSQAGGSQVFVGNYHLAATKPEQGYFLFVRTNEETLSGFWWKGALDLSTMTEEEVLAKVDQLTLSTTGRPWEI